MVVEHLLCNRDVANGRPHAPSVFEQTAEVLEQRFGFRVAQYGLRQVFPRIPDHPLLAGLILPWAGPDALTRVSMFGNDMALDSGVGNCGKDGQTVPVGVGQPTLRIDGLTVGGTA